MTPKVWQVVVYSLPCSVVVLAVSHIVVRVAGPLSGIGLFVVLTLLGGWYAGPAIRMVASDVRTVRARFRGVPRERPEDGSSESSGRSEVVE